MGGLFRAMDFFCYLVILLQTTLYIANGTVKNTMDAVLNEFTEERHRFIKSFFRSISVIQLDFSGAVKLPCLGGDPLSFEKTYAALTCLVVLVYVAALLLLPRLRLFKGALAYIGLSKARNHLVLLYQQFAYRVGTWLVLTHAVSLKVSLGDKNWADDPAWAFLFLIHCIGFPLAILFGAMHVRTTMLGGTCCHDMPETMARHNSNVRATGELGLWRYYLDYDYKARFHWFRAVNMAVLVTIVGSETSIRPPAAANATETGEYDLSRTCIQATAVLIYLLLLLVTRPYVGFPNKRHEVLQHAIRLIINLFIIRSPINAFVCCLPIQVRTIAAAALENVGHGLQSRNRVTIDSDEAVGGAGSCASRRHSQAREQRDRCRYTGEAGHR